MTNFYKRYIYKNGVKHGPYYYSNKKVNGKVISTYLGTSPPTSKEFKKPSKSQFKFNIKLLIILLSAISFTLIIYLSINLNLFSTGQPIRVPEATSIIGSIEGEEVSVINDTNISKPQSNQQNTQSISTVQGPAIVGQPVLWEKEIELERQGPTMVLIPDYAENIVVYKVDEEGNKEEVSESSIKITAKASAEIELDQEESAIIKFFKKIINFFKGTGKAVDIQSKQNLKQILINENSDHYVVEYSTPAPAIAEEKTDSGKVITFSGQTQISYENVLISTSLDENLNIKNPESVKILWVEQDQYIVPDKVEDTDSNGIYDSIEFIAPSSNQTYEIIVITKAEHLDSNKVFISDIYNEVKELDDVWSEEIKDNEYVRVTFEQNLTKENDITIYPRTIQGNPKIEVYEKNSDLLIAEFLDIIDNEYNQVLLTNIVGEQDTFDLKIVGGSVEFDYIVDPVLEGDGRIVYGEGTVTTPRTRIWVNSTQSWENPESSLNAAAATIRHVVVKSSPVNDEMLVGIQSTAGQLYIQRWNGSAWSSEWNVAVGNGNLPRFDIAYEQNSGEALVVYGTNTATNNEIAYRVWNGNSWLGPTNYNAIRTSGVIQGLAMVSLSNSNDIAIAWGDSNLDLSANYWNGATNLWVSEPASALSTGVDTLSGATSLTTWSFDLEFESLSGELLIAWGNAAATDISYVTRGAGAAGAWGSVSLATAFAEQSDDLEMSADPNSNQILLVHTGANSGADMEAAVWTGTAFPTTIDTIIPCAANVVCAIDISVDTTGTGTSGNAGGWLTNGANTRAIVTYDDVNAAGIDWAVWNPSTGWTLQTDCTTACNSQPASGDDKLHRVRINPFNRAELMFLGVDSVSDLYAKKLNLSGTTLTWSSVEPLGLALETSMSSIIGFAADFAYNKFIPIDLPPSISNPNTNETTIVQNEFFCLNATVTDGVGVSSVFAEVWNTSAWLNYTMTETGGSCSGGFGDGVYGVAIQGTAIGLWNYSKVYANDSSNNLGMLDFLDLTINVTSLANSPPTIDVVGPIPPTMPIENNTVPVNFLVQVSDSDGILDIASVNVNFTYSGEPTRLGICSFDNGGGNTAIYSCTVNMQYYDIGDIWNVNVTATDSQGALGVNNSQIFSYGSLSAIVILSPIGALTWPTLDAEIANISSDNDPVIITNTGNVVGLIFVTAHNLTGETNPGESIPATNFWAGVTNGAECGETQLQESPVWIISAAVAKGSDASPNPTEQLYFCLRSVPSISSQNYSATGANAWIIQI